MNRPLLITIISSLLLACGLPGQLRAADADAAKPAAAYDDATQKRIDTKADHFIGELKLADTAKAARVKVIMGDWFVAMWNWHKENDAKLNELWSQWNKDRAVVPKDEYPGEVIAHQIDDVYASLKPEYKSFMDKLATELTPEQIDAFKEAWSRSPGMTRTYNAYLETVPDLNDDQKKVIYNQMFLAREDAMLTDSKKEIINLFKCHKVKVEEYVGALEWDKLLKAFANKGKTPAPAAPDKETTD